MVTGAPKSIKIIISTIPYNIFKSKKPSHKPALYQGLSSVFILHVSKSKSYYFVSSFAKKFLILSLLLLSMTSSGVPKAST